MRDIVYRALHARTELVATLWWRGVFLGAEKTDVARQYDEIFQHAPVGSVQLATPLAEK